MRRQAQCHSPGPRRVGPERVIPWACFAFMGNFLWYYHPTLGVFSDTLLAMRTENGCFDIHHSPFGMDGFFLEAFQRA